MSLYKVEITYVLMIAADSPLAAEMRAEMTVGADGAEADEAHATEVTTLADIPKEWLGCIPFGDKSDLTCEQRLS